MKDNNGNDITRNDIKVGDYIYFYSNNSLWGGTDKDMISGSLCRIEKLNKIYITAIDTSKDQKYQINPDTIRVKGYGYVHYMIYIRNNETKEFVESINTKRREIHFKNIEENILNLLESYKLEKINKIEILSKIVKDMTEEE